MRVPEEFDYLTQCFWDGSHEEAKTLEEWVAKAVGLLNAHQKAVVKPFVDDLLSRDLPDKELHRIWNEGGARYIFPETSELRRVLRAIRDDLSASGREKPTLGRSLGGWPDVL